MIHIINNKTTQEQSRYVYVKSVARIMKAYYAWYVSDVNGSMPYLEAFQARYGGIKLQNMKLRTSYTKFLMMN